MAKVQLDSSYTQQLRALIVAFYDPSEREPSIIGDAKRFFETHESIAEKRDKLERVITADKNDEQVSIAKEKLLKLTKKLGFEQQERVERLNLFIDNLLLLTDAGTAQETNNASAKFLGTLLLTTDPHRTGFAKQHQLLKPLYKAALSLRLCDAMLAKGNIRHPYLGKYIDSPLRYKNNPHWQARWRKELAYPLVKAALLQDFGLFHTNARQILFGENQDLDEFRLLEEKERVALLKLNLKYSMMYLNAGIGLPAIKADTHQEKKQKVFVEEQALEFALEAVKDATILKNHVGDLIKIPQIYSSFILSTKSNYSKKDVPKGYMVIEQLMKNKTLENRVASCFLRMVGYFPQGYGLTYIALDDHGNPKDGYELAIVNRLYPEVPAEPVARAVTRNLTFTKAGRDVTVKRQYNLYFQTNHKKIQRVDKARLNQILAELTGGPENKTADDMVPQFWEPSDFFSVKDHQNLWTTRK